MKKVPLSSEEIADRGQHLAGLIDRLYGERQEKRERNAEQNEVIKKLEKEIAELSMVVRTGVEFQDDDVLPFESTARAS